MENYDSVYTVEFNGSKGWEVAETFVGLTDAINAFRGLVLQDTEVSWRLTTPNRADYGKLTR